MTKIRVAAFQKPSVSIPILVLGFLLCLFTFVSASIALILGCAIALIFGNPLSHLTKKMTPHILSVAIVGMGFGTNLNVVGRVGLEGIGFTVLGIISTFLISFLLGKLFQTSKDLSVLITTGTAICGGSAIAAVSPVIEAKNEDTSMALITVFLLNAVGLFIFPVIGHSMGLSEMQFGLWSALSIHDTSSVVGATLQYGPTALEVGTTVKLARALWIVPLTLTIAYFYSRSKGTRGPAAFQFKIPWFILGFLIAAALVTWIPALQELGDTLEFYAKRLLVLTLFLIGAGLTREALRNVGLKAFLHGFLLWLTISTLSLGFILL